jgi:hypothetical protein
MIVVEVAARGQTKDGQYYYTREGRSDKNFSVLFLWPKNYVKSQ